MLMERVGVGFPETDQVRVEDWPEVMEEGAAAKDEMTGAAVAADTLTVIVRLTVPTLFVAVKV